MTSRSPFKSLPQHTKYSVTESEADNYTTTFGVNGGSPDDQDGWTQSGSIGTDNVVVDVKNELNGVSLSAFTIQNWSMDPAILKQQRISTSALP